MPVSDHTAWESNATLDELRAWLAGSRSIVILSHVKPDGDALGSSLALARSLNAATGTSGATSVAEVWFAAPMPSWASSYTHGVKARILEPGDSVPAALDPEHVVIVDTGSWSQLEPFREWLGGRADSTAIIDHHAGGNGEIAERRFIDTGAAAACEPVAELCSSILGLGSAAQLPKEIASALYLGLATDTGWFRHSNVTRSVMHLAGELIEAGADHTSMYEMIAQRERPSRLRLMQRALASLEIVDDLNLAIMSLRASDFAECGAAPGESGGFVDIPQTVASVRVTALLTEQDSGGSTLTKLSLRSKSAPWNERDPVDVNRVAAKLGGGGHARAAGARLAVPLRDARDRLVEALR